MEYKCSFKVGTPTPITFRETFGMPDDIDIELSARIALNIGVAEYDEAKYGDCEELTQTLKGQMQDILTDVLNTKMKSAPLRNGIPPRYLKPAVESELLSMGITAEVEIISFVLTEESEKLFNEKFDDAKMLIQIKMATYGDPTDRPFSDQSTYKNVGMMGMNPDDYKSDCVPPPLFDPSKRNIPLGVFSQLDKFCRNCGAKRSEGAKFCTECGSFFN